MTIEATCFYVSKTILVNECSTMFLSALGRGARENLPTPALELTTAEYTRQRLLYVTVEKNKVQD